MKAPLILWGPYLWTDGEKGRKDGLTWELEDVAPKDGVHEAEGAQKKAADQLLKFFKEDAAAKGWFAKAR